MELIHDATYSTMARISRVWESGRTVAKPDAEASRSVMCLVGAGGVLTLKARKNCSSGGV